MAKSRLVAIVLHIIFFPWFLLRWMWRTRWVRWLSGISLILLIAAVGALGWLYHHYIVMNPGEELSRSQILRALSVETPVYYDDGKELLGVFFENEHRMYIKYEDIPKDLINAMVAAEDKNFFRHYGIDPLSILRATVVNLRAGRIVQGGSTLSQQTAKNLFKRKGRTFEAKGKELLQTLKLEAHYSKEEILEFFLNQFFVSGTGRGLGIAARYFFDKSVDELTLLECAFIAGSVRAPNNYNSLIQSDPEKKKEIMARAIGRKNYVLRNMLDLKMISPQEYAELVRAPIPFRKGKIYYRLNVIMDYVRDQLQSEAFQQVLSGQGISNVSTSGIQVYTSINKELQEACHLIVRKQLSHIETLLAGYEREAIQTRYSELDVSVEREPRIGKFLFGQVEEKVIDGKESQVDVRLGSTRCRIDYQGLMNLAMPYAKSKKGLWAEAAADDVQALLGQIEPGDIVYVSVREEAEPTGENEEHNEKTFLLNLEQNPQVEGGLIVMNRGKIIAMVGGAENIYFNRAVNAQRQLGSIFKPLVYTAALQLGWNIVDALENRRDVFVFQNEFYFPRPDHVSPYDQVSLGWAGVKSENLASIWLLYYLCDQLTLPQFEEVARLLDFAPREGEGYYEFRRRMRDRWGIIVTNNTFREMAFETGRQEIVTDLIFEGRTEEVQAVRFLKYGAGFDDYREALRLEREALELEAKENEEVVEEEIIDEYELKESIMKKHFLRYHRLNVQMLEEWDFLKSAFRYSYPDPNIVYTALFNFYTGVRNGERVLVYGEDLSSQGFSPLTFVQAHDLFGEYDPFAPSFGKEPEDVWIEGEIRSSVISMMHQVMEKELPRIQGKAPYDMATLWKVRDYRVLVGLFYVVKLCHAMGIETDLSPVLSFPLGPNAVNILEVGRAYSTLLEGKRYGAANAPAKSDAVIIEKIIGIDGEEQYRFIPDNVEILDAHTTTMVNEILRNVVVFGTGRRAQNAVTMTLDLGVGNKTMKVKFPAFGKTGTANEYSNSSYVGFIPGFADGRTDLSLKNAFVIAVYVGYDDNRPMENDHLRIYGGTGALPIWIDAAKAIVKSERYQQAIDPLDFAFLSNDVLSLQQPSDAITVPVNRGSGLPLSLDQYFGNDQPMTTLYSYGKRDGRFFRPARFFNPLSDSEVASTEAQESAGELKGDK